MTWNEHVSYYNETIHNPCLIELVIQMIESILYDFFFLAWLLLLFDSELNEILINVGIQAPGTLM